MKAYKGGKSSGKPSDISPNLFQVFRQYEKQVDKVIPNESEKKYSGALIELVKPYHNPVPTIDELEELMELATIAWNMANIKKLVPQAYQTMLQEAKSDLAGNKKSFQLLEKLVKHKEEKYADYDMFIHDFQIKADADGETFISVIAKPLETFLSEELMDEEEEDLEDNLQPGYINRNAFIVKPRQPFIDWIRKTDNDPSSLPDLTEHHIYLIDEQDSNKEVEKWLKKNFDTVFKKELEAWYADKKAWPAHRTYKMFREWFDVEYHSMVYDLEDFPVDKDLL